MAIPAKAARNRAASSSPLRPVVPQLEVVARDASFPVPDLADPELEIWTEADGTSAAFGYTVDGQQYLELPGVATFRLNPGRFISARPHEHSDISVVEDSYRRTALPISLQIRGMEVLHASAIRRDDGVTAICGRSTMGKSTIAFGLSRRGHSLWADDAVAVQLSTESVACFPLPSAIRLRPSSRRHFKSDGNEGAATELRSDGRPQQLASIVVLERVRDGEGEKDPRLERMEGAAALRHVLPHAYCFTLKNQDRKRKMLQQYAGIVRIVPVFRLVFPSGLEILPRLLDLLESQVTGASTPA